jgi:hypothetical protein
MAWLLRMWSLMLAVHRMRFNRRWIEEWNIYQKLLKTH